MAPITLALLASAPAGAGVWNPREVLQGVFVVASPPEAPVVAANAAGHALAAWDDTGNIRYAERSVGGPWSAGANVRRGATGGPVQAAIGTDETAVIAWITVGTEFVPSHLVASVRAPGAAGFAPELTIAPGAGLWWFDVGVTGDGTAVITWTDASGVEFSSFAPGDVAWSAPLVVSDPGASAALPDLAVDDAGDVAIVWQQGAPSAVASAYLAAGSAGWESPAIVSTGAAAAWGPRVGLDAAGGAAVGFVDGTAFAVSTRTATSGWGAPVTVSGPNQVVTGSAFATDDAGDLLAAYQVLDPTTATGRIWASSAAAGGAFGAPSALSRPSD
ncbi:MAG: hypothetical protein ABMB14_05710, partial [Myxococcota bacterium]